MTGACLTDMRDEQKCGQRIILNLPRLPVTTTAGVLG